MQRTFLRHVVNYGLLAVLVIAPTQYALEVMPETFVSPVDPLVWLVCLLWLMDRAGSIRSIRLPAPAAFVFVALSAVSVLKAASPLAVAKEVFQYTEYFLVTIALIVNNVRTDNALRRIVYVLLGVTSLLVAVAGVQYFWPRISAPAVGATLGNRNLLGGYLSLALPLAYGISLFSNGPVRRIWCGTLVLAGLLFCLSGGTWIALLLALGLLSALRSRRALLLFAALALLLLLVVLPRMPRNNDRVLLNSIALYDTDSGEDTEGKPARRYAEWQAGLYLICENPWIGVGAGNYHGSINRSYFVPTSDDPDPDYVAIENRTGPDEGYTKNLYLVLAASLGLPGLVAFLALLMLGAAAAGRSYFTSADDFRRGLSLGLLGAIFAFSVNAVWADLLVRGVGLPLAVVLALAQLLRRYEPPARGLGGTAGSPES